VCVCVCVWRLSRSAASQPLTVSLLVAFLSIRIPSRNTYFCRLLCFSFAESLEAITVTGGRRTCQVPLCLRDMIWPAEVIDLLCAQSCSVLSLERLRQLASTTRRRCWFVTFLLYLVHVFGLGSYLWAPFAPFRHLDSFSGSICLLLVLLRQVCGACFSLTIGLPGPLTIVLALSQYARKCAACCCHALCACEGVCVCTYTCRCVYMFACAYVFACGFVFWYMLVCVRVCVCEGCVCVCVPHVPQCSSIVELVVVWVRMTACMLSVNCLCVSFVCLSVSACLSTLCCLVLCFLSPTCDDLPVAPEPHASLPLPVCVVLVSALYLCLRCTCLPLPVLYLCLRCTCVCVVLVSALYLSAIACLVLVPALYLCLRCTCVCVVFVCHCLSCTCICVVLVSALFLCLRCTCLPLPVLYLCLRCTCVCHCLWLIIACLRCTCCLPLNDCLCAWCRPLAPRGCPTDKFTQRHFLPTHHARSFCTYIYIIHQENHDWHIMSLLCQPAHHVITFWPAHHTVRQYLSTCMHSPQALLWAGAAEFTERSAVHRPAVPRWCCSAAPQSGLSFDWGCCASLRGGHKTIGGCDETLTNITGTWGLSFACHLWETQAIRKKKLRCSCAVGGRCKQLEKSDVVCVLLVGDANN